MAQREKGDGREAGRGKGVRRRGRLEKNKRNEVGGKE